MTTPLITAFDRLVTDQWAELAGPGAWWNGTERVAIAELARAANDGITVSHSPLPAPAIDATIRLATEAHTIRREHIEGWTRDGMAVEAYVEMVGIVSRLAALDTAMYGLGLDRRPLPLPQEGNPTGARPEGIEITDGWVPTDGPCYPPTALSVVPGATDSLFANSDLLYMPLTQMKHRDTERDGISRPLMELVAARTSYLNQCVY